MITSRRQLKKNMTKMLWYLWKFIWLLQALAYMCTLWPIRKWPPLMYKEFTWKRSVRKVQSWRFYFFKQTSLIDRNRQYAIHVQISISSLLDGARPVTWFLRSRTDLKSVKSLWSMYAVSVLSTLIRPERPPLEYTTFGLKSRKPSLLK